MTKMTKFVYFIVAVLSMVGLAVASVAMAEDRAVLSTTLFIVTFLVIAVAFIMKARIRARSASSHSNKSEV